LQTTGAGVTPSTIPGNRAEVGKMLALKGSRKCDPTHRKRQLTSYADRFGELAIKHSANRPPTKAAGQIGADS